MNQVGAKRTLAPEGRDELPGRINYIRGNDPKKWTTDVHTYRAVRYPSIYPGIDMIFSGSDRKLEYSFVLSPYTDERQIEMNIDGADHIKVGKNGDLLIQKAGRTISFGKPIAYQIDANTETHSTQFSGPLPHRHLVEAKYILDHHRVRFWVQHHDRSRALVIDPTLSYSTYVGGSNQDYGTNVVVDAAGDVYASGYTASIDFPTTAGALQTSCGGGCANGTYDAYVLKLNASGTALLYATYLGGSGNEYEYGLFVDSAGDAYVTGETFSNDFPVTAGAFQTACSGHCISADGFITELNPEGSGLIYSTYIGGSGVDRVDAIVVDSAGNAYITGGTQSTNFPVTLGVFQPTCNCVSTSEAFVAEMNPTGTALIYSSYLGGSSADLAYSIAIDTAGNAFLTGYTQSTDFPVTVGAFQTSLNAPVAAFVTKVSPDAKSLIYSTYLGGSSGVQGKRVCYTCGTSVVVNSNGNALVTGLTLVTDFPTTPGAYQTTLDGAIGHDAFVTNLNSSGTGLLYSTLLGGANDDGGTSVALDNNGNIYIRGNTLSTDLPVTGGAVQSTLGGSYDAFVAEFDPTLSKLLYSTYLGGQAEEFGMATHNLALDSQSPPNIFVTGYTLSTNFPTTAGAFQGSSHGLYDAFLTKIAPSPNVSLSLSSVNFGNQQIGTTSSPQTVTLTNTGNVDLTPPVFLLSGTNASDFAETDTCSSNSLAPQASCTITLTFTPTLAAPEAASLSITDNAPGSPQSISVSGTGVTAGPIVTLSATKLTFPTTVLQTSSAPQSVTLTNSGSQTLTINSFSISGDFTQANTCGTTVNPGNSCFIRVTFIPTLPNTRNGTLTITDNASNSPQTISLTGVGTAVQLSPSSLNFGTVSVGTSSSPQTVTLTNVGGAAVNFKQIAITGKDPADYSQVSNCLPSVAAGASCSLTVTFTPAAKGSRPASLTLTDNGGGSPQLMPLSGSGQ
ncbi:MAG TPA: choice-of-anchor D domain-containing protein [Candidatus Sulfotelmatobacter sp.]|nr:choice-of-anchor D domain-containing protein [Candidatus Sulfotelmatobacter sp.]